MAFRGALYVDNKQSKGEKEMYREMKIQFEEQNAKINERFSEQNKRFSD